MAKEIEFTKYVTRGAGYHWEQNSRHLFKMNAFVKARYQKIMQLLKKKNDSFAGVKIIDLGCGDGVLTYELFKKGAKTYGIDLSDDAIKFAIWKHRSLGSEASFFVESCTDTHFGAESFDAAVSSDVIEHLTNPRMLLTEIYRVLKPNGLGVISTPIRFTQEPLDKMHTMEWFKEEFKGLVKDVFPIVEFEYSHPVFWYELMNRSRQHRFGVNLLSYIMNPFLTIGKWRFPAMQYAIIEKS